MVGAVAGSRSKANEADATLLGWWPVRNPTARTSVSVATVNGPV